MKLAVVVASVASLLQVVPLQRQQVDLDTAMMNATFRIVGPSAEVPGALYTGTGFLVGKPSADDSRKVFFVAVTALHVLQGIQGDVAYAVMRGKDAVPQFQRVQVPFQIRQQGAPAWKQHSSEDVAVMYIRLPTNHAMEVVPEDLLATDEAFEKYGFHPGDEVSAMGYPFGYEVNQFGFPLLRSGRIASYPLTPVRVMKQFFVDFSAFGGNSGGPVYISSQNRTYNNTMNIGSTVFRVLGVITQNVTSPDRSQNAGITKVVHAQFIREAIDALPSAPTQ